MQLLSLFAGRLETLIPLLTIGFFLGEIVAQFTGLNAGLDWLDRTALHFRHKLNRADRSIATRIYRGMIAAGMFLLPALIFGIALAQIAPLCLLLIVALFGRGFQTFRLLRLWNAAKAGTLGLEIPGLAFLFADHHAVLRYLVLTSAERFASHVIGLSFWYVIGGMPIALCYLVLAEIVPVFTVPVFGWACGALWRLVHFIPVLITSLLLVLGGVFTPHVRPFSALSKRRYFVLVAQLLNVSLGGTLPGREMAWYGGGTAKLLPSHLGRWLILRLSATVVLVLVLAASNLINLLKLLSI